MKDKKKKRKRFIAPRVGDPEGMRQMGAPVSVKSTLSKAPMVKQRKPPNIAPKVPIKVRALGEETGTEILDPSQVRCCLLLTSYTQSLTIFLRVQMQGADMLRSVMLLAASAPDYISRDQLLTMRGMQQTQVGPGSYETPSSLNKQAGSGRRTAPGYAIKRVPVPEFARAKIGPRR
jgi:hypothetical protein